MESDCVSLVSGRFRHHTRVFLWNAASSVFLEPREIAPQIAKYEYMLFKCE